MPGKVKVRIIAGRNLPVMDRSSDTSDAFVEVKLGNTTYKTEVCRRTLNPQWNTDWFRFEVDDEELQDEPLQIRIMDYDTYSANDAIGKVYIDLNPLLCKESLPVMSGWFPIYDTMHGIRGEINVAVKVDLFSDFNKYRVSSCGIQFFFTHGIPQGYHLHAILGLVEELVVNDDPEYQWIDKIRTPRSSNEARQTLFSKLSGELQRKIGLKASDLGANAVVGYQQCFDLEGEYGIVVRGIGTAVRITKVFECVQPPVLVQQEGTAKESAVTDGVPCNHVGGAGSPTGLVPSKLSQSPAKAGFVCGMRHSSDSDLSMTPRGNGICPVSGRILHGHRSGLHQEGVDMLEYPFVTMKNFPPGVVKRIGGVVAAKSVRKLSHINNPDEPETRDAWWTEIRKEMRSHARAYACNVILGYSEAIQISDDVCVLSACGTAALLTSSGEQDDLGPPPNYGIVPLYTCPTSTLADRSSDSSSKTAENGVSNHSKSESNSNLACSVFHVPYSETSVPFVANLVRCNMCRKAKVPDFLMMTIEPPPNISVIGKGCLLQARVCRIRKDGRGEHNAKEVSDIIPFLEYEIHKQIMCKVKVKGMNIVFGIRFEISLGEKMIALVATGTAAYVSALPPQNLPKISLARDIGNTKSLDIQRLLEETVARNRERYDLSKTALNNDTILENHYKKDEGESSDEDKPDVDLYSGNKDICVLEIDDEEDIDAVSLLIDPDVPNGFECCNTSTLPGTNVFSQNLQFFFQIYRTKLPCGVHTNKKFAGLMNRVLQCLFVKLRNLVPCCLAGLSFHVDIPEQDEVQICALGVAVAMTSQPLPSAENGKSSKQASTNGEVEQELLFSMDMDKNYDASSKGDVSPQQLKSVSRLGYPALPREHHGVDLSSLSYIPGGRVERYLGNLDFFFIRESTSIREGGGLNGFIHSFISEVLAILRAHVAALGGNAVVALHITQCVLLDNPHKNQAQCLINIGGDAVQVQYMWDSDISGKYRSLSRESD